MLPPSLATWTTWAACCVAALASSTPNTPNTPEHLARPRRSEAKPVKLDFTVLRGSSKNDARPNRQARLVKRATNDGSALMELENQQSYYSCDLYIGSNGQKSTVLVDTGSSDLWIMDTDMTCYAQLQSSKRDFSTFYRVLDFPALNNLKIDKESNDKDSSKRADSCEGFACLSSLLNSLGGGTATRYGTQTATATAAAGANSCTKMGSFETRDSDSFKVNNSAPAFSIQYADGTSAQGFWGHDQVGFNGHNVSSLSFATVNETDSTFGVLGIGLAGLETTYSSNYGDRPYTYENLPIRMRREGIIDKIAYSLYLNKQDASSGSLLFGAVDHAKYTGTLQTIPVVNIYLSYYSLPIRLDVVLDSIIFESSSQNITVTSVAIPALLDSGTTLTYLPTSVLSRFTSTLGASYSSASQMYQVNCKYNSDSLFAIFNFSGIEIKVPLSDMILKSGSQCYLGVLEQSLSGYKYAILGDNFLRNAYIVYNLEDLEILMAQVNYTDEENIEIVSLAVPLAVKAPGYSSSSIDSSETDSGTTSLFKASGADKPQVCSLAMLGLVGLSLFAMM